MNIFYTFGAILSGVTEVPAWVDWAVSLATPLGFIGAIIGAAMSVGKSLLGGGDSDEGGSNRTAALSGAMALGGSLLSGRRGRGQMKDNAEFNQWAQKTLVELGIPVSQEAVGFLRDIAANGGLSEQSQAWIQEMQQTFPEIRQEVLDLSQNFDSLPPEIREGFQTVRDAVSQANDRNMDTLAQPGGMTPQQQGTFDRSLQLGRGQTDEQNAARDTTLDIFNNRGETNQSRFLFESAQDARNRVNDPRFDSLLNVSGGIIGNGGFTQQGQQLFDAQMGIINAGGQTVDSQRLIGATQGLIDSGGMTPELQRALGQVESELQSGGLTPESRLILDEMTQIVQDRGRGGALLGFDEALGRAGNQAQRNSEAGREQLIAQARQRATPGSVIGSGLVGADTGRLLAQDFAARTAAVDQAALNQQGLQLQQLMGAGDVSANILNGANQRFATLQGSRGDLLRAASSNLSSAIQGNVGAQGVETSRLIGAINGANATNATAANMFGQAVGLTNTVLDHQLGLLNLSANAANASGQMVNNNLQVGNSIFGNLLGSQQSGLNLAGALSTSGANQRQQAINSILQGGQVGNQTTGMMLNARGQNINMGLGLGQMEMQQQQAIMQALQTGDANALNAAIAMGNIGQGFINSGLNAGQLAQQAAQGYNNTSSGFWRNVSAAGFQGFGNSIKNGALNGFFGGGGNFSGNTALNNGGVGLGGGYLTIGPQPLGTPNFFPGFTMGGSAALSDGPGTVGYTPPWNPSSSSGYNTAALGGGGEWITPISGPSFWRAN